MIRRLLVRLASVIGRAQEIDDEEAVRIRADQLQAVGPDEFPRGYYEHVARSQLFEGVG